MKAILSISMYSWNFLNPIGIQLYDEHCKDVAKTMAAHYEEMSRISGQTKI